MSLCDCEERPRCTWSWCQEYASWTVMRPRMQDEPSGGPRFMCDAHYELYRDALTKPIRGLDPMADNDEYFRPSIGEMIRHGMIAVAFEDREFIEDGSMLRAGDTRRYTKAQLPQALWLRRMLRAGNA